MKIGFFSDPHCGRQELCCGTRRPALSLGKMEKAAEYFRSEGVDLVVCLGDLINGSGDVDEGGEYLRRAADVLRNCGIPFYCMIGNHDLYDFDRDFYYKSSGLEPLPLSVKTDGVTLVFLDACCLEDGRPYFSDGKKPEWKRAYVADAQIAELEKLLSDADPDEKFWILSHQSLDPLTERSHIIRNAPRIREILLGAGGKVKRAICGHYHAGGEDEVDGIKYTVVRGMCNGEDVLPGALLVLDTRE